MHNISKSAEFSCIKESVIKTKATLKGTIYLHTYNFI